MNYATLTKNGVVITGKEGLRALLDVGAITPKTPAKPADADEWSTTGAILAGETAPQNRPATRPPPLPAGDWWNRPAVVFAVGAVCIGTIVLGGIAMARHEMDPAVQKARSVHLAPANAQAAAAIYLQAAFPGASTILDSKVARLGGSSYQVQMLVDGKNAFGGPVRKMVIIDLDMSANPPRLLKISQH